MSNGLSGYASVGGVDTETLVREHAPMVRRIALHMAGRLPASVSPDDLLQAGLLGLLEAARSYDPNRGAAFATYAGIRIRGAMVDELRKGDWTPRSVHRRAREVAELIRRFESRGKMAEPAAIAEAMGVSLGEYQRLLMDVSVSRVFNRDWMEGAVPATADLRPGPLEQTVARDFHRRLAAAVLELPERERLVVALYYQEELNLKEIGAVLGVSESRVSQIHGQALLRLRGVLQDLRD